MTRFPQSLVATHFRRLSATLGAISLLAVAACTGTHASPPAVELRTQTVEVPVALPCLTKDQYDKLLADAPAHVAAQLSGDAPHDLDIVTAYALRMQAYVGELQAAMKACAKAG